MMDVQLSAGSFREYIRALLRHGTVSISETVLGNIRRNDVDMLDIVNVLRAGRPEIIQEEGATKCRVSTQAFTVVAAFVDEARVLILEAWRNY